jgi:nitrogen fixation protein FixH
MAELKGRHVLAITVSAFGVIIAVNILMAFKAVSTFPGLEVKNSYVASQSFDAERKAQEALGWTLTPAYDRGELRLAFTGRDGHPVSLGGLTVLVGRTTDATSDQRPTFADLGGVYAAPLSLAPGKWMMQVEAHAQDGTLFRQRIDLMVDG